MAASLILEPASGGSADVADQTAKQEAFEPAITAADNDSKVKINY